MTTLRQILEPLFRSIGLVARPARSLLDRALDTVSTEDEPDPLPMAHIGCAEDLASIADSGRLESPSPCELFKRRLLYLSYGTPFFRSRNTRVDPLRAPTAFLFGPERLADVASYFPVDSGAMGRGFYTPQVPHPRSFLESTYRVNGDGTLHPPCKMVKLIYDSNSSYIRSKVSLDGSGPEPLGILHAHLAAAAPDMDRRQRTIECIVETGMDLGAHLLWIAAPKDSARDVERLFVKTRPNKPIPYLYPPGEIVCPFEILGRFAPEVERVAKQYYEALG